MSLSPDAIAAMLRGDTNLSGATHGATVGSTPADTHGEATRTFESSATAQNSSLQPPAHAPPQAHPDLGAPGRMISRAERAARPRAPSALIPAAQIAEAAQIELAVLASLYTQPRHAFPMFAERGRVDFFFNPAHRQFFSLIHDFYTTHGDIDPAAFVQHISDLGHLSKVGGPAFLGEVLHTNSPLSSFTYHLDILRDKYVARELSRLSSALPAKLSGATDETLWVTIAEHERAISDLRLLASDSLVGVENFAYADLVNFDATKDPTVLIGSHRWLGRGYTCLWAGGSGYGKSTLEMQAALYWATGTPFFGIRPVRPLKSLIIQAENDLGDTGEQFQGVLAGIKATGDLNLNGQVERMFVVNRLIGCSGDTFLSRLDSLLKLHKPDLVWIDPLFSFAGCDLMDTASVSRFLREGLMPIAVEHEVCAHVIHHISKPARDNDAKAEWTDFDFQFLGFGSSEIQNAFRAVNILIPVSGSEGVFRLVLSKRGTRAGAKDIDGEFTTSLYLTHSKQGEILWSQVDKPAEGEKGKRAGGQPKYRPEDILQHLSIVTGTKPTTLKNKSNALRAMSRATFYRIGADLESKKLIVERDKKWFLAPKNQTIN